ncbi:23844_t:CDS:1, partial [Racocetra persica]
LAKKGKEHKKPKRTLTNDILCNNNEITEIDISNESGWDKLEIKDCENLETLIADNCDLKEIKIINCPNLKTLSFNSEVTPCISFFPNSNNFSRV